MERDIRRLCLVLVLSSVVFCGHSQDSAFYRAAYNYIYKSKELKEFLKNLRTDHGIIVRKINISDSAIENDPYPFLCAVLKRKMKSNENCSRLIGNDRLKVYDSIRTQYHDYIRSKKFRYLILFRATRKKRGLVLSFSDYFKNSIAAQIHYYNTHGQLIENSKSLLYYFVFYPNGRIRIVFTAEIQNK
jgi:hypothetical protein